MMTGRAGTLLLVLFMTVIHSRQATAQVSDVDYRRWLTSPFVTLGWSLGDINISLRVERAS